ncbi:MAG: crossover junction endodeoxyribonuclease RuvC [Desulfobacteraceae bacterium]|jgi:Holliday junction resolvasome RuvABC endonuclease subunit
MSAFVGVDQALRKTGVCVIEENNIILLERIVPPKNMSGSDRLLFLRNELQSLLLPFKERIIHASMEAQSLGSIGAIDQLGQISGVVQVVLKDMDTPHFFKVPPTLLKKFVTNNGQASKKQMMDVSKKLWGINFTNDDLCDAHGLARISEEFITRKSSIRHQVEVVTRLLHTRKKKHRIKKNYL